MYEKFGQFIDVKWCQSSDKSTYEVINPANEEIIGHASKATTQDIDRALESAEKGLEIWKKAVENITPAVEVKSRRVGGATFQIPTPVRDSRKRSLAIKWLIGFSLKRNEKTMSEKLAGEILAASKEEGASFKKKEDVHRMAEANKAFSHFRF